MLRTILHIDFDSFFASCEQQLHPEFRGKPLGVTATNGRNCIIASSREAKKLGIGTGTPLWIAKDICPEILTIPANFDRYWEYSQKFIKICKDFSPFTEVFSIDEVFMDVTPTLHLYGGVYHLIKLLKKRILNEIGPFITVSVGISYNKLLAKLGSGLEKPNGMVTIRQEDLNEVYKHAKLTDICGIGERIKIRLNVIGINTLIELQNTSLPLLIEEFGHIEGKFLYCIGHGIDSREVIPYTESVGVKSISRNYCLPHNEYDKMKVLQNVYELCEEVAIKLRRLKKYARTAGLYLAGTHSAHGHKTLGPHIISGKDLFRVCKLLYDEWGWNTLSYKEGMVRRISVWVGNLYDSENLQLSFLENIPQKQHMLSTIDAVNDRFGDHTIRNGFLLYADKLTTKPNGWMADRFEREKLRFKF